MAIARTFVGRGVGVQVQPAERPPPRGAASFRIRLDPKGLIVGGTVSVASLLGRSLGDLVGTPVVPLIHPDDLEAATGTWDDVLNVLGAIWPGLDLAEIVPHGQPPQARWLTPISFHTHTWGIGEEVVVAQHGLLTQKRAIVPHRRMQSASLSQGPLQRRLGLATVAIHTTDGPVSLELSYLHAAIARRVLEEQVARARAARAVSP